MVVAPDSGLVLFHNFSERSVDLKNYIDSGHRSGQGSPSRVGAKESPQESLTDLANRRYTSIVYVRTILALKDRAALFNSDISMRYARDLRPDDSKSGNAILLGAPEADPWIELYENKLKFLLLNDYKGIFSVINRQPQPGEPAKWESRSDEPRRRVYGVIAFLPSLAGDGNVLLLEGTGMSEAEAGMDFVLDDSKLLPFLSRLRRKDGSLKYFEMLLETKNIGASAVRNSVVALHIAEEQE